MFWETLRPVFQWSFRTGIGVWIRDSTWAFAYIEVFHLFGLTILLGAIFVMSFRLAGLIMPKRPVAELAREFSPWTTAGLAMVLISGALLFAGEAMKAYDSQPFRVKAVLLAVAIVFHFTLYRGVTQAPEGRVSPLACKLTAGLALTLWFGVGIAGRAIGFF